jgi:hypothetical protein
MPKPGNPWSATQVAASWRRFIGPAALVVTMGCEQRDRFTFPTQNDGIGPVTLIDQPAQGDTVVDAGPLFFLNGRSLDTNGVDTVYFLVAGGNQGFPPLIPSPPSDTVRFGLPVSTAGRSGEKIEVQVYGVDADQNRGAAAVRQITIR